MNLLKSYDKQAQQFIINIGKFIYDKSKTHFNKINIEDGKIFCNDFEINELIEKNKLMESKYNEEHAKLLEMNEKMYLIRDEEREKSKEESRELINFLKKTNEKLILTNEEREKNFKIEKEEYTRDLKKQLDELKEEYQKCKELYENTGKGKQYEGKLYDLFQEYNSKYLNNVWEIKSVGDISKKTDMLFRNKYSKKSIMLDAKNNITSVPVVDIEKFKRDIKVNNYVIGGIMAARGTISSKTGYELDEENNKKLLYLSNVDLDNVGFIFNQLDMLIMMSDENVGIKNERFKKHLINWYKSEEESLTNIVNEEKNLKQKLEYIKNIFLEIFNQDIDIEYSDNLKFIKEVKQVRKLNKNKKINNFETLKKEEWIKDNISYDIDNSKKYIIKGEKSENFIIYNDNNKEILQYFKSDSGVKGKITSLYNKNIMKDKLNNFKNEKLDIEITA